VLPERLIEPAFKYKSAFEDKVLMVKTPVPTIFMSFVHVRPLETIEPVVFVVRFQKPVQPVNVGFTEPLSEVETDIEAKAH
jgi:hypothetical protein